MTAANTTLVARVTPVIDYEPRIAHADEPASPAGRRRSITRTDRRRAVRSSTGPLSPRQRGAAAFADAALRTILEVIDLRRPVSQLRPLMDTGLADAVVAFTRAVDNRTAAAVLRRARLQECDHHERAFEVAAAYSRQSRLHAIACRIEHVPTAHGGRWQIVALHLG